MKRVLQQGFQLSNERFPHGFPLFCLVFKKKSILLGVRVRGRLYSHFFAAPLFQALADR